jgi:hypothetical protein
VKELALIPIALFLGLGAGTLLPVASGVRTHPNPHTTEPVLTAGPRAWAVATTAVIASRNGERLDMLAPGARNDSSMAETRRILHDWWSIDHRADLLRVLDDLDRKGHRAEFQRVGSSLLAMTEEQFQKALLAARNRPEVVRRMKLTRRHYQRYGRNGLVGWDYGRYIMLCRWGYLVGFLTEDEAWRRIMPAARAIQGAFRSWAELGEDYLAGREFWSPEEMDRTGQIYRNIEARLVQDPESAWNRLPWRTELGAGTPSPRR